MVSYKEKLIGLRNKGLEDIVRGWKSDMENLANEIRVPILEVEKQVRLHLGQVSKEKILLPNMPADLAQIINSLFKGYPKIYDDYILESGANVLLNTKSKIVKNSIQTEASNTIGFSILPVPLEHALFIERHLHYLKSPKSDDEFKFGIYLDNSELPICYMSLGVNDRPYKHIALENSIQSKLKTEQIYILSRVYGFGNLPKNSLSVLLSACVKELPCDTEFLITAINPHLTFSGTSMLAAGFIPFASCPVSYKYRSNGRYTTRRHSSYDCIDSTIEMPKNMLLVRGLTANARRSISKLKDLYEISFNLFDNNKNIAVDKLNVLRERFEMAWNDLTRYHGTPKKIDAPISKGQCGVTTAYLAKMFEDLGHEVLFCEGEANFPNPIHSIKDHCWLKLRHVDHDESLSNIIIDLTADQNGYPAPIICAPQVALELDGIFYTSKKEMAPNTVKSESLQIRLEMLRAQMRANG